MVTIFFASILTLMYLAIGAFVIQLRYKKSISILTGKDEEMALRVRAHGNFQEYMPIFLILLYFTELQGTPTVLVIILGTLFTIGRVSHACAFILLKVNGKSFYRIFGMILTFMTLFILSFLNLYTLFF